VQSVAGPLSAGACYGLHRSKAYKNTPFYLSRRTGRPQAITVGARRDARRRAGCGQGARRRVCPTHGSPVQPHALQGMCLVMLHMPLLGSGQACASVADASPARCLPVPAPLAWAEPAPPTPPQTAPPRPAPPRPARPRARTPVTVPSRCWPARPRRTPSCRSRTAASWTTDGSAAAGTWPSLRTRLARPTGTRWAGRKGEESWDKVGGLEGGGALGQIK
jgi:hypothetical protein